MAGTLTESKSNLSRVTQQLSKLEKRDWELWTIVTITGILVSASLLAILFRAAFLTNDGMHFELTVSRPLAIGLFILLGLLNTYLVSKRFEVRRLREQVISTTLQNQVIEQQSFIDPLTEIYNRHSLDQTAGRFISQAIRRHVPLVFLMVDVNNFKQVNTRFGHLTGDFVLAEIASVLKSCIRASDAVIRYGGDEFLIILADTTEIGADKVTQRIHRKLDDWNDAGHLETFCVKVSIGAVEWHEGDGLDDMLDKADRRMYAQKPTRSTQPVFHAERNGV
ncbi:MAG: GGDEF domain-containing protein [Terriglobales bacterium]